MTDPWLVLAYGVAAALVIVAVASSLVWLLRTLDRIDS